MDPNKPYFYLWRGVVYYQQGDYDSAIEDVTKALELEPDNAPAYIHRSLIYRTKGDYDSAIEDVTKTLELEPNNFDAYIHRGLIYRTKGDYDRSLLDFNKAIQLNPNDVDAYNNPWAAWLRSEVDEETKSDQTTAEDIGKNIITSLRNEYGNIPTVNLPEELTSMPIAS